jgi:hypothetical protein
VQVCGQCHVNTQEHYRKSPHFGSEDMQCRACHEEKTDAYRGAGCTACHKQCGHCHREADPSREIAAVISAGRRRLEDAMEGTRNEIRDAKARGLFIDQEEIYLRESKRALVSLQPLAHSLDRSLIDKALQDGLKRHERAREVIAKQTTRLRDRRILVGALTAILLLLTALLAAKLRAVRRLS